MHIGEPELSPLKPIRELLVIKSEAMQDRRLEIVNVNRVFHDVE